MRTVLAATLLGGAALAAACVDAGVYRCVADGDCGRGACVDGACGFVDPSCPSGLRYGGYGPAGQAGQCVDVPLADGVVAQGDGPLVDAGRVDPDASTDAPGCAGPCEAAGGACDGTGVCVFTCMGLGACGAPIACPTGIPCRVLCEGTNSCMGGVSCAGPLCEIQCDGRQSCGGPVDCSGDGCSVTCTQDHTCEGGITCTAASCSLACTDNDSCDGQIRCGPGRCTIDCAPGACGPIDCSTSCACGLLCEGSGSCALGVTCPSGCRVQAGCEATGAVCDTCGAPP